MAKERPESFSIDDWKEVLGPHARARGPSFFKYSDDAKTCKEAKCCSEEIVAEKAIINGILAVNKVAVRSVLSEALKGIWLENKPRWQRPQSEAADWQETMTRRLSNAMHHVNVVKSRPQKPAWFLRLVAESAEVQHDEVAAPPEKIYYYDVDVELKSVYRVDAESRTARPQREYCVAMTPSSMAEGSEMAPMIAKFADGSERLMPELTRARYETQQGKGPSGSNDVWSGEHCITHNSLHLKKRPDRGLLISLFEQTLQVCSIPVDWLETNGWRSEHRSKPASDPERFNAPNTEAAVKRAIDLMMAISKDYAENKIAKDVLYKRRDEELNKMGTSKVVLKKRKSTKSEPPEHSTSAVADDDVEAPGDPDDESKDVEDPEAEAEKEGGDPEDEQMEEPPPAKAADDSEPEQEAKGVKKGKGRKGKGRKGKAAEVSEIRFAVPLSKGSKSKRPVESEPHTFAKNYRLRNTLDLHGLDDEIDQRADGFIDG
jgi:hypothetical protein